METQSGRGWLINAFGIFLLVLSLWILAALWAGTSFGATFPILADLRSQIFADYGSDIFGQTLKSLQISILGDFSADTLFADGSSSGWDLTFQDPVPTATSSSASLEDEPSPTPTEDLEPLKPTITEGPEHTSTIEPEAPTITPLPSKTPKPTSTPSPQLSPEPTQKFEDGTAPILSGGVLSPPPGDLTVCEIEVAITDLEVADPAWSSGIEWVKLKYKVDGYSDYIYSSPLTLKSGGATVEGGWLGCYSGDVHIEIDPEWDPPEGELFRINLWAKARDHAGLMGYLWLGEYTMPGSCGGNFE